MPKRKPRYQQGTKIKRVSKVGTPKKRSKPTRKSSFSTGSRMGGY